MVQMAAHVSSCLVCWMFLTRCFYNVHWTICERSYFRIHISVACRQCSWKRKELPSLFTRKMIPPKSDGKSSNCCALWKNCGFLRWLLTNAKCWRMFDDETKMALGTATTPMISMTLWYSPCLERRCTRVTHTESISLNGANPIAPLPYVQR